MTACCLLNDIKTQLYVLKGLSIGSSILQQPSLEALHPWPTQDFTEVARVDLNDTLRLASIW